MKKKRKNKKNKNKKIILFIVIGLILLITLFISYKVFIINKYNLEQLETKSYDKFLDAYNKKETYTTSAVEVKESDYLTYENIKIKNVYKGYTKENVTQYGGGVTYKKYNSKKEVTDTFKISIMEDSYIDWFEEDDKNFYGSIENDGVSIPLETDVDDYLEDNYVYSDNDLFKFLNKTRNYKPNIFTPGEKIRSNYAMHLMASITMPAIDKFVTINGIHNGYMLVINDIKEVHIKKGEFTYNFLFTNKTEEEVLSLLNTLVIEQKRAYFK